MGLGGVGLGGVGLGGESEGKSGGEQPSCSTLDEVEMDSSRFTGWKMLSFSAMIFLR